MANESSSLTECNAHVAERRAVFRVRTGSSQSSLAVRVHCIRVHSPYGSIQRVHFTRVHSSRGVVHLREAPSGYTTPCVKSLRSSYTGLHPQTTLTCSALRTRHTLEPLAWHWSH
jgi:hypothetical protein